MNYPDANKLVSPSPSRRGGYGRARAFYLPSYATRRRHRSGSSDERTNPLMANEPGPVQVRSAWTSVTW